MLSSAIPKRLVVSLVLVGLVSLFMTSFAGLTSERVSAQATGTDLKGLNFGSTITVQAGMAASNKLSVKSQASPTAAPLPKCSGAAHRFG